MTNEMKEICERDGQDCTQRNNMPMMAIEQSEQELKPKGTNHASTKAKTKGTNTSRNP